MMVVECGGGGWCGRFCGVVDLVGVVFDIDVGAVVVLVVIVDVGGVSGVSVGDVADTTVM